MYEIPRIKTPDSFPPVLMYWISDSQTEARLLITWLLVYLDYILPVVPRIIVLVHLVLFGRIHFEDFFLRPLKM